MQGTVLRSLVVVGALALGCEGDDGGAGETGDTGNTDGSEGFDPCEESPGIERCPCQSDDDCRVPLVCYSDVCVDEGPTPPPGGETGDDGATGTGTDTGTGGDEPDPCTTNSDCTDQVCFEGFCAEPYDCNYNLLVHEMVPYDGCSEGGLGGNKDMSYELRVALKVVYVSTWDQGECPGLWSDEVAGPFGIDIEGFDHFFLEFYDEEFGSGRVYNDVLCFNDGADPPGSCNTGGALPKRYLVAGRKTWETGKGSSLDLEFLPTTCL